MQRQGENDFGQSRLKYAGPAYEQASAANRKKYDQMESAYRGDSVDASREQHQRTYRPGPDKLYFLGVAAGRYNAYAE